MWIPSLAKVVVLSTWTTSTVWVLKVVFWSVLMEDLIGLMAVGAI